MLLISDKVAHDTYGELYGTTGTQQTVFGFTGEETDANGLVNLRARYYNPVLGQFMGLDPLEGIDSTPMSLNRYMYVQGNVINAVDPSGNRCEGNPDVPQCPYNYQAIWDNGWRCRTHFTKSAAVQKALTSGFNSVKQGFVTDLGGSGTLCVAYLYYVLHAGGMPELLDPQAESGYLVGLGFCTPFSGGNCSTNAKGVDPFINNFLNRGGYSTNPKYAFLPPVEMVQYNDMQPGDIIHQQKNTSKDPKEPINYDHTALFVGWGPHETATKRQTLGATVIPGWISKDRSDPNNNVAWVIDEQTKSTNQPIPTLHPFDKNLTVDLQDGGYQVGVTGIYRIPDNFSIDLGYLAASTPQTTA